MAATCLIRPAAVSDLAAIATIERASFADPWSDRSLEEALTTPGTATLVAELPTGAVAGYLVIRWAGGSGEVLNLAVDRPSRRRGVGRALLEAGIALARQAGVSELFLEVRESNRQAQRLYTGLGFRPAGLRKGYYHSPREDALVLRATLPPSA